MYIICMPCAYKGQKRVPDPIELESIVVEPENCEKKYQFHNYLIEPSFV